MIPFGCLPAATQSEQFTGLLFDLTDDPRDGETVLRLTNNGTAPLAFTVGDVGIAWIASTTESASALNADSARDGFDVALAAGETMTYEVPVVTGTTRCDDRSDATSFAPILAVALDGEPVSHPLVGAGWRS